MNELCYDEGETGFVAQIRDTTLGEALVAIFTRAGFGMAAAVAENATKTDNVSVVVNYRGGWCYEINITVEAAGRVVVSDSYFAEDAYLGNDFARFLEGAIVYKLV